MHAYVHRVLQACTVIRALWRSICVIMTSDKEFLVDGLSLRMHSACLTFGGKHTTKLMQHKQGKESGGFVSNTVTFTPGIRGFKHKLRILADNHR